MESVRSKQDGSRRKRRRVMGLVGTIGTGDLSSTAKTAFVRNKRKRKRKVKRKAEGASSQPPLGLGSGLFARLKVDVSGGTISQEEEPKKVVIVGAGVAGVTLAIEMLSRGYEVVLFEKQSKILSGTSGMHPGRSVLSGAHYPDAMTAATMVMQNIIANGKLYSMCKVLAESELASDVSEETKIATAKEKFNELFRHDKAQRNLYSIIKDKDNKLTNDVLRLNIKFGRLVVAKIFGDEFLQARGFKSYKEQRIELVTDIQEANTKHIDDRWKHKLDDIEELERLFKEKKIDDRILSPETKENLLDAFPHIDGKRDTRVKRLGLPELPGLLELALPIGERYLKAGDEEGHNLVKVSMYQDDIQGAYITCERQYNTGEVNKLYEKLLMHFDQKGKLTIHTNTEVIKTKSIEDGDKKRVSFLEYNNDPNASPVAGAVYTNDLVFCAWTENPVLHNLHIGKVESGSSGSSESSGSSVDQDSDGSSDTGEKPLSNEPPIALAARIKALVKIDISCISKKEREKLNASIMYVFGENGRMITPAGKDKEGVVNKLFGTCVLRTNLARASIVSGTACGFKHSFNKTYGPIAKLFLMEKMQEVINSDVRSTHMASLISMYKFSMAIKKRVNIESLKDMDFTFLFNNEALSRELFADQFGLLKTVTQSTSLQETRQYKELMSALENRYEAIEKGIWEAVLVIGRDFSHVVTDKEDEGYGRDYAGQENRILQKAADRLSSQHEHGHQEDIVSQVVWHLLKHAGTKIKETVCESSPLLKKYEKEISLESVLTGSVINSGSANMQLHAKGRTPNQRDDKGYYEIENGVIAYYALKGTLALANTEGVADEIEKSRDAREQFKKDRKKLGIGSFHPGLEYNPGNGYVGAFTRRRRQEARALKTPVGGFLNNDRIWETLLNKGKSVPVDEKEATLVPSSPNRQSDDKYEQFNLLLGR